MKSAPLTTPTISRVLEDGTLIELVYDPAERTTELVTASATGQVSVSREVLLPTGERLVPYSASNTLITSECVLLPSAVGIVTSKEELLAEVRAFLHRYVDLSPTFEGIAAHYVLLSWAYDAFEDLPYLRLRGDFGSGKTRGLLTIGSLCYKTFFASGASTVSPIFHILDAFGGTLVLDEADFPFSDATAQLTKILNNGTTRGLPVLRTMSNRNRELNPQAFKVYGPKLIAMREQFSDPALESRFITEDTSGRRVREDVPVHLPAPFREEARELRNKLLAWRLRCWGSVGVVTERALSKLGPRYRQSSLALLSLVDDEELREAIGERLAQAEGRILQDRSETMEALILRAIAESFATSAETHAPVADITARFNALAEQDLGRAMSNKWVGNLIRTRLRIDTYRTGGVYVVSRTEKAKVDQLSARYGLQQAA